MRKFLMVMLAFVFCCSMAYAAGGPHVGLNDPETEGFVFDDFNSGVHDPQQNGTAWGDTDEEAYWFIARDGWVAGRYLLALTDAELGHADGWTATARMKGVRTESFHDAELGVLDGLHNDYYSISMVESLTGGDIGTYDMSDVWGKGNQIDPRNPSEAYRTYQIIYDPAALGVTYYIDGVPVGTMSAAAAPISWGVKRLQFGDTNGLGPSAQQWSYVSFQTGQHPIPVIPGDANTDGVVDEADAAIVAANWLTIGSAAWFQGDFNSDDNVNDTDATLMAANWGYGTGLAASVPEPGASVGLLMISIVFGLVHARRRRKHA